MGKVVKAIVSPFAAVFGTKAALQFAAIAVNFIPGIGQLASLAITAGLSLASSLLAKKPKTSALAGNNDRLNANINTRAFRTMVFGATAMATDIRDQEFTGTKQEYLHRFMVIASHKVQSVVSIYFDDKLVWTLAGGVDPAFAGYLDVAVVLEGSAANAINISPRMGLTRRYTGLAYVHFRYKLTGNSKKSESPFSSAVTTRVTIIGKGIPCYDPRQDTTVGGSGAHRADNQATWTYGTHARNPACQALTYLLGWRINGKLAVGKGIPPRRFDMGSFMTAANVCDENVPLKIGGTEPRYRGDGIINEGEGLETVLGVFEDTMDARFYDPEGRIAVKCLVNDLAAPVASFGPSDILGQVDWKPSGDLSSRYNIVRGTYTDASVASLYQSADYPEYASASLDGIERTLPFDLPMVQSITQAQRLAKRAALRAKFGGELTCEMQATAWRARQLDAVALTFPNLNMTSKKFRVAEIETRLDGIVPITLAVEDALIYDWNPATDEVTGLAAVASTPYDPANNPFTQALIDEDAKIIAPATRFFSANFAGVLDAEQLPATLQFRRFRGTTDVSASAVWTVVSQTGITGGTVTISNGNVTIPAGVTIGLNSSIPIKASLDGIDLFSNVTVTRNDGGLSTGSGGGSTVSDSSFVTVSGTTKVSISDEMTVKTGASGTITFSGGLAINAAAAANAGDFGAIARWQYKTVGGAYANVGGADIFSSSSAVVTLGGAFYYSEPGSIDVATSLTGLAANTDYVVRLMASRDTITPSKTISFGGTVYAQGT